MAIWCQCWFQGAQAHKGFEAMNGASTEKDEGTNRRRAQGRAYGLKGCRLFGKGSLERSKVAYES